MNLTWLSSLYHEAVAVTTGVPQCRRLKMRFGIGSCQGEKKNAEEAYGSIAKRFTGLANEFLLKVRSFGKTDVTYLPKELRAEEHFRTGSKFQFYDFVHIVIPASPLRYMADVLLGLIR